MKERRVRIASVRRVAWSEQNDVVAAAAALPANIAGYIYMNLCERERERG